MTNKVAVMKSETFTMRRGGREKHTGTERQPYLQLGHSPRRVDTSVWFWPAPYWPACWSQPWDFHLCKAKDTRVEMKAIYVVTAPLSGWFIQLHLWRGRKWWNDVAAAYCMTVPYPGQSPPWLQGLPHSCPCGKWLLFLQHGPATQKWAAKLVTTFLWVFSSHGTNRKLSPHFTSPFL